MMMVLSIFLYVGSEVSMSSQIPIMMDDVYGMDPSRLGLLVSWGLFFLPIFLGRLVGSAILRVLAPVNFLIITVLTAILGIFMLITGSNPAFAFSGIFLIGFGFANIFPLVFSITIDKMPERANELSGLMVFAIVGGAFVPLITGKVADLTSPIYAFLVPMVCMVYIGTVGLINKRNAKQTR